MAVLPNGDADDDSNWSDSDRYGSVASAPLIITLVLPIVIGAILLLKCVFSHCCMRQTPTKEEMFGVEGRVTALSQDEPVIIVSAMPLSSSTTDINNTHNISVPVQTSKRESYDAKQDHVPLAEVAGVQRHSNRSSSLIIGKDTKNTSKTTLTSVSSAPLASTNIPDVNCASSTEIHYAVGESEPEYTDSLKRSALHRELPDLPNFDVQRPARRSNSVLSHDETSELYATVGEVPNQPSTSAKSAEPFYERSGTVEKKFLGASTSKFSSKEDSGKKRHGEKQADTTISSDSETYGNNISTHPYAKLKRVTAEHPYARVGPTSNGIGDEETDTDNYDTPHPYAQTTARAGSSRLNTSARAASSSREVTHRGDGDASEEASVEVTVNGQSENPVPPRRAARLWRRSNQPVVENQQQFSGDSQDSRGYTSISVREPLSNIINKRGDGIARNYDGLYATVSDDSEEMYAAIEDAEGNYMRIPDEDSDGNPRHWAYAVPNIASPIPERREANSPLPPPPIPPVPGQAEAVSPTPLVDADVSTTNPPLYAQVTKKNKKAKPSTSSAFSSQTNSVIPSTINISPHSPFSTNEEKASSSEIIVAAGPEIGISNSSTNIGVSPSENRKTVVNGSNESGLASVSHNTIEVPIVEPRRWSKADISFSEFEVVREPLYCAPDKDVIAEKRKRNRNSKHLEAAAPEAGVAAMYSTPNNGFDVVDDGNYNVILERPTHLAGVIDITNTAGSSAPSAKSKVKEKPFESTTLHGYQEIQKEEFSDYYQEIGPGNASVVTETHVHVIQHSESLYHQIDSPPRRVENIPDIDDEDEQGDEFYETVKPATTPSNALPPRVGSAAEERYNRKHGYEKLKKKNRNAPMVVAPPSEEDDDDDDDEEDDGVPGMYEKLKYPPYDRLKESRDDLSNVSGGEDNERNFYETIGYSRANAKNSDGTTGTSGSQAYATIGNKNSNDGRKHGKSKHSSKAEEVTVVDVDQLYARVDKTKKKRGVLSPEEGRSVGVAESSHANRNKNQSLSSDVTVLPSSSSGNPQQTCILLRKDQDDNSIEYI